MKKYLSLFMLIVAFSCNNGPDQQTTDTTDSTSSAAAPKQLSITITNQFPHDVNVFTEGLEIHDGSMYESGGNYKQSALLKYDLKSGKVDKKIPLDGKYFGEGITILNDKVYQLTYQEKDVLVYSLKDLSLVTTLRWPRDGWGMTNNGKDLYITDGTSNIYLVNPDNFQIKNIITVTDNNGPVNNLNELELIDGKLYCNRWQTPNILVIDPATGKIESVIDIIPVIKVLATNYHFDVNLEESSPNGIAYDPKTKQLIVTGKLWPASFEIKINQ